MAVDMAGDVDGVVALVVVIITIQLRWGRGWVTGLDGKQKLLFHLLRKTWKIERAVQSLPRETE